MFFTVCTRYIHVALAAYVPMLWERFTFGHSCNYSVVLSKNVSTWNKKNIWLFFYIYSLRKRSLVLVSYSLELPWEKFDWTMKQCLRLGFVEYRNLPEKKKSPFFILPVLCSETRFLWWRKWEVLKYLSCMGDFQKMSHSISVSTEACFSLKIINKTKAADPERTAQITHLHLLCYYRNL